MSERHVVFSADSHCGADLWDYKGYLESRYHEEFDDWARSVEAAQARIAEQFKASPRSTLHVGVDGDPVEDTRRLLGLNAIDCYGLDESGLRAVAARVGPTPEDLGQGLDQRTPPDASRRARWWLDEYGCEMPYA